MPCNAGANHATADYDAFHRTLLFSGIVSRRAPPSRWRSSLASREQTIQSIAQAVVAADEGQEPRVAVIKWMLGEFRRIEGADRVRLADDLAGCLIAEICHHGDAAAVAAERVVHAVVASHMRHRIEGKGDIAGPGMGDANA